jgi:hypothetical protein
VTLLAPGAMLLAAALAVPVLAVFYLLKLRRRPMRVTSTMLWDQAARDLEVNVPFRWIRPSLLLLLHALILAALLIAIGRPALTEGGASAGRVFLLIDRSASMNAPGESAAIGSGMSRLALAKDRAKALVEQLSDGATPPEFTVIAFASDGFVVGPPASDAGSVSAMIDAIEPTDEPGDPASAASLVRALTTAGSRVADESEPGPGERPRTARGVVFTDGGDLSDRSLATGAVPVTVEIVGETTSGASTPINLGIVGFAAEREIEDPSSVRIFARLINTGAAGASVPLVVRLDGEPIDRRAVTIPPASGNGSPGERAESIRLTIPEGGVLRLSIERDDALAADNTVHAVLPPVRRPAVLVVVPDAGSDAPSPRDRVDPILLDVLDAIGTAGVRVVERRQYAANADQLTGTYGLVVFDRVRPGVLPRVPTISLGAPIEVGNSTFNAFVRAADRGRTPVLSWNRDHPVMRDAVLDTVFVGDRMVFPEDDEVGERIPDEAQPERSNTSEIERTTLARGNTGPLILALDDGGIRRIATAFALDQTNWPVHFSFPIFVLSAFDFLVPNSDAAAWFETRDEIVLAPRDGTASDDGVGGGLLGAGEITVEGPVSRVIRNDGRAAGSGTPIGRLSRVGLYRVSAAGRAGTGGDGSASRPVPVNLLSPSESSLRVASRSDDEANTQLLGGRSGEGREIWRWFVLAAGIGLLLEWLVFTLRSRA